MLTWTKDSETVLPPAPTQTIVQIDSLVSSYFSSQGIDPVALASDSLDGDGTPIIADYGNGNTAVFCQASGTHYLLVNNPLAQGTVQMAAITVSVSAIPGGPNASGFGYVSLLVSPFPVTLNLNGALKDNNGNLSILVGQGCTGILSAGPYTLSTFQWTVPGVTFDHFYMAPDQSSGGPVFIDPSVWETANPNWYWSSSGNYTVSATAQASINGQSVGTATAQSNITVVTPPQIVVTTPGASSFEKDSTGSVTAIQGGSPGGSAMEIDATVTTPNPFAQFGYYGDYFFVQLIDKQATTNVGSIVIPWFTNGYVLDNEWPYNGYHDAYVPDSPTPLVPLNFSDSPDLSLNGMNGVSINDGFKAYLMYQPPGNGYNSQPVPIHLTQWNWNAAAALSSGLWSPDPPGNCTVTSDSPSTEFPTWSASFTNQK